MSYKVVFRPSAEADLIALYDYIAQAAGSTVAAGYIARIEVAGKCRRFRSAEPDVMILLQACAPLALSAA